MILQPHTPHTPAQVVEAAKEVAMETEAEVTWQQHEQEAEAAATQRSAEPAEAMEEEAEDPRPAEEAV